MKKFLLSLVIIAVLSVVGGGIIVSVWASQKATPEAVIEKPDTTPRVAVQVLQPKELRDLLYLVGVAEPWEAVTISAEVTGKIEWQGVDDGDPSKKDQELVRINTTMLQARLDQARADFKLAEEELKRQSGLRDRGISSPQDFDRATMNRESTAAMLKMAEIEFAHSVIHAEFDGVVDRVYTEPGEFVSVGKPLVRLVQVDKLKVLVGLPERDVARFKVGDSVLMRFDSQPDKDVSGRIYRIATTADAATRTFISELEVDNSEGILKPGMIARVALVRASYPDAISVPMFAVMSRPEGRYVFVEDAGHAVQRPVDIGFYQDSQVYIPKGLNAGDRLIVAGQRTLRDGQPVVVAPETSAK